MQKVSQKNLALTKAKIVSLVDCKKLEERAIIKKSLPAL